MRGRDRVIVASLAALAVAGGGAAGATLPGTMPTWLYALLLFVPATVVAELLALSPVVVFVMAAAGLIPLAGLIGRSTEELAHHLGPRYGGLLNATFGNAAELIITTFAVRAGLLTLVKASITGSIIGNTLLVLGASLLAGGLRHGEQRYDPRAASLNAALMILAVAGLYLPATVALTVREPLRLEELSLLVAGILLLTYVAYLVFTVSRGTGHGGGASAAGPALEATAGVAAWTRRRALAVLALSTVGAAVVSEALVGAVEPVTEALGWSEFFVGVIVVALIGNAAEHVSAVTFAWRNQPDVSLAITADSSTQMALFVAPVLVFLSIPLGHPMDLIFVPLELAILGLSTAVFGYLCLDGESHWLEGAQLLSLYLMAAAAFFFLPTPG
jgi:Ca2+:H+ antiporter